jgi:hypothetical protein
MQSPVELSRRGIVQGRIWLQRQLPKQIRISYQANLPALREYTGINCGNHLVDHLLAARRASEQ